MAWPAITAARSALAAGALLVVLGLAVPAPAQPPGQAWTNDQNMFLFYQAFLKIQEEALEKQSGRQVVRQALRRYLEGLDPYSTYLSPREYEAHKNSGKAGYSGVGMDVYRDPSGELVCLPHPGSPAEKAGIHSGDRLVSVDGRPVEGLSLLAVGDLVRGPVGSRVRLVLRTPQGERSVRLQRRALDNAAVSHSRRPGVLLVRVLRFDSSTPDLLRQTLAQAKRGDKLVIDLRSCRGGSLFAGVDAADLLLPSGKTIVTLRRREESKTYRSRQAPLKLEGPLFLWQDRYTASSAELMIAALVQNRAARSVGTVSFGKASTQKVFPLQDGSALVLTDGRLLAPDGHTWNQKGLRPSLPLPGENPGTEQYLAATTGPAPAIPAPRPAPSPPPSPPPTKGAAPATLLARVIPAQTAPAASYYVCLDTPRDSAQAAREQAQAFADKMPPELAFVPTASELVSSARGKFFACLPPQPTRGQAQQRLAALDRRGVGVLGIKEGQAPQASANTKPTPPNPADWFIQVNRFDEANNAWADAKALAGKGVPVTIMITVPRAQYQKKVAAWLQGHRLAGEVFLCPAQAKGCGVSYSVLAGPYYAQAEELRHGLLGDWPGAFWLQRKNLPYRY